MAPLHRIAVLVGRLVGLAGLLGAGSGFAAVPSEVLAARVFQVRTAGDSGTAFVLGPAANGRCVVLTALHVIRGNTNSEPLLLRSPSGSRLSLRKGAFTTDAELDLAFAPAPSCKESLTLALAKPTAITVSTKVLVVGYPADQEEAQVKRLFPAMVNGRITQYNDANGYDLNYDAATKPGYSGGPVIAEESGVLLALHGFSDTVGNIDDPALRERMRVGGRGVSSALIYRFLKSYGYVLPRSQAGDCLVGMC
jgi:S1-C subfamily serine protease